MSTPSPAATRSRFARPRLLVAFLAMTALFLGACSADTSTDASVDPGVRVVSSEQATEMLAVQPRPVLIDVRTPAEFAESHLEGAVLVDFNAPDFRDQIAGYPRDAQYVIYCRSGNRSAGAREIMTELGFTDVADIEGGILAWTQSGHPVTT